MTRVTILCLTVLCLATAIRAQDADRGEGAAFDADALRKLVGNELVDPGKLERIEFRLALRTVWGGGNFSVMRGWRRPGQKTLILDDGFEVNPFWPPKTKALDLRRSLAAEYEDKPPKDEGLDDPFARMDRTSLGLAGNSHVVNAAFLLSINEAQLAEQAWKEAQAAEGRGGDPFESWRRGQAWFYYAGMVHAYMQGADEEAERYGTFLLQRYRAEACKNHPQSEELLAEIQRRRTQKLPAKIEKPEELPLPDRVDYWIAQLEQVDVRQWGQPGGVNLGNHESVKALIAIGDPAIPKLLDAFEHDQRFTRSVHFWRDFAPSRTVLRTQEAALTAIMSILRTEFFGAGFTGDNLSSRAADERAALAAKLRAYWKRYGKLPFEDRMMTVLCDKAAPAEARYEAAVNLTTPGADHIIGTTVWSGRLTKWVENNPALAKFREPSVAEAMLAALDDELTGIAKKAAEWKRAGRKEFEEGDPVYLDREQFNSIDSRHESIEKWTWLLSTLGDRSMGRQLAQRASGSANLVDRCDYSLAADRLGDSTAVKTLRDALQADELDLPARGQRACAFALFHCLTQAPSKDALDGLNAIANLDHQWFRTATDLILTAETFVSDEEKCLQHPWALEILTLALGDTRPTERTDRIQWDEHEKEWELNKEDMLYDASALLDESKFDRSWNLRACDAALELLEELLGDHERGRFEPLSKERDQAVARMARYMERHRGRFREFSEWLDGGTGFAIEGGRFLPVLPPLGRAATFQDVADGHALFALPTAGRPPEIAVPVSSWWLGKDGAGFGESDDHETARQVVVVQIERDAAGDLWFAIADGNGLHVVPSREIGRLDPIPLPEKSL